MPSKARVYRISLRVPVFGEIPLHPKEVLEDVMSRESPLWAQFFKYGVCGVLSTLVLMGVVALFHFYAPEFMSESLPVAQRQVHLRIALLVGFVPANLFAYFTNRWLVFSPGKRGFWGELSIFMIISAVSFIGGEVGKMYIVHQGLPNWMATISFAISSALVNFVARKLIVFAR